MITSLQNPKIKLVRRLLSERRTRQREKAFVVESTRWLQELVNRNHPPHFVLATEAWLAQGNHADLLAQMEAPILLVAEDILQRVGEMKTNAGILAVVPYPRLSIPKSEFKTLT